MLQAALEVFDFAVGNGDGERGHAVVSTLGTRRLVHDACCQMLSAVGAQVFASAAPFAARPANTVQLRCVMRAPRRFSMLSLVVLIPLG